MRHLQTAHLPSSTPSSLAACMPEHRYRLIWRGDRDREGGREAAWETRHTSAHSHSPSRRRHYRYHTDLHIYAVYAGYYATRAQRSVLLLLPKSARAFLNIRDEIPISVICTSPSYYMLLTYNRDERERQREKLLPPLVHIRERMPLHFLPSSFTRCWEKISGFSFD